MTYPGGARVQFTRDAIGRIAAVSVTFDGVTEPVATDIQYAPFGPLRQLIWGDSSVMNRRFDAAGRLLEQQTGGFQHLAWTYAADGNIIGLDNLVAPEQSQRFDYDALNRLIAAEGSYGALQYAYDAVGNRTRLTEDGAVTDYAYAPDSNRLLLAGTDAYEYDALGNTTQSGDLALAYDARGRLSEAAPAKGKPVSYAYNALGQRVLKTVNRKSTLFAYDMDGHLIGEYDESGKPIREYIYLGDLPIAMLRPKGKRFEVLYIHTDHLGTPKLMTNNKGHVRWEAQARPFGLADAKGKGVELPLRFPGQLEDAETGLHYNYIRDYAPTTGRYIESDPIGLDGGLNPYIYVAGNPMLLMDPLGLRWVFRGWSVEKAPWYMYWWTDYVNVDAVCVDECTSKVKKLHARTFQTRPMCINEVCPGSPNDPTPDSPFRNEAVDDAFDLGESMARAWDCGSLTGFECFIATTPPEYGQEICDALN